MIKNYDSSVLILIDVQNGIDELFSVARNNPTAESNMLKLLKVWREKNRSVIHVKHNSTELASPLRAGQTGNDFKPGFEPVDSEPLFEKSVNSAFIGTELENYLRNQGHTDLVIVGLTTDHCVSTTTRMAANLGFNVVLVSDATATFGRTGKQGKQFTADEIHTVNLLSLDGEFCQVMDVSEVMAQ